MTRFPAALLAVAVLACAGSPKAEQTAADSAAPVRFVDSILPMDTMIARFRAGLPDPGTFDSGAAPSRDALVRRFLEALARRDSSAIDAMVMTRAEFAWIYFPHHAYAAPPYELPPQTFWMLIRGNSDKGRTRLLQRLGGTAVPLERYDCRPSTTIRAPLREWEGCRIRTFVGGAPQELALFGSIVEHQGRFKFASLANDF
jgi:hypothetical protein